jgi:hypothetical protein
MQVLKRYLIIPVLLILSGCATTARISQFDQFAEAGKAYADAVTILTEEAGNAAIDTDSLVLIKARDRLSSENERKSVVLEHNELLKERLQLLRDISRHALLLKSYFVALSSLAQSDAPSGIGTAAEGVVNSLGQVSEQIKTAKIGGGTVSEFVGTGTTIAIAQFQRSALETELKNRAVTIARELDLQQAVLQAIATEMQTDLEAIFVQEANEIVVSYKSDLPLPGGWSARRKGILSATVSLASAEAAADAAKNLKLSFVALVENRLQLLNVDALMKDIDEILTLIEKINAKEIPQGE